VGRGWRQAEKGSWRVAHPNKEYTLKRSAFIAGFFFFRLNKRSTFLNGEEVLCPLLSLIRNMVTQFSLKRTLQIMAPFSRWYRTGKCFFLVGQKNASKIEPKISKIIRSWRKATYIFWRKVFLAYTGHKIGVVLTRVGLQSNMTNPLLKAELSWQTETLPASW